MHLYVMKLLGEAKPCDSPTMYCINEIEKTIFIKIYLEQECLRYEYSNVCNTEEMISE